MTDYLLDANVVSEVVKPRPEPRVLSFLATETDLWLSAVVLHEVQFGIQKLDPGRRRDQMRSGIEAYLPRYVHRFLRVDSVEATVAATMRAEALRRGRTLSVTDALIAATARVHGLTVATRNVKDFQGVDVDLLNPWDAR